MRTKVAASHHDNQAQSATAPLPAPHKPIRTLVIDIGGTGIKAMVLNEIGEPIKERKRISTPRSGKPEDVIEAVRKLSRQLSPFHRISVGFPGVVRSGVVGDAVNLAGQWKDFNLTKVLESKLKKPVRAANDADVQGFGAISGKGVELVLTLGTGVGSSLFVDGRLVPNVEVGKDKLRHDELGRIGRKRWNRRLLKLVGKLEDMFHYDRLYIGGGNAEMVNISLLPGNVTIVSNLNGLLGGLALWNDAPKA
jgi:polyphosphate glucokinase